MAEKRRKRKRKTKPTSPAAPPSGVPKTGGGGGGVLQSMRSGFRQVAGVEQAKGKPSKLSNAIWTILLIAALALLAYRLAS
jgi:hypothetical protein